MEFIRVFKDENQGAKLARLIFNAIFWFLWKERNDWIFNEVETHKTKLFQIPAQTIQSRMNLSSKGIAEQASLVAVLHNWNCHLRLNSVLIEFVKWVPPLQIG